MILFVSGPEILFVAIVVVLLFGAKKLPEIASGLGRGIRQVRDATNEIKREIHQSGENKEFVKDIKEITDGVSEIKKSVKDVTNPIAKEVTKTLNKK